MKTNIEFFDECYPIAISNTPAYGRLNAHHGLDVMQGVIVISLVNSWDSKKDLFEKVQKIEPDKTLLSKNPFA